MKNVLYMLEAAAEKFPEKIAIANQYKALTYKEYLRLAQRVGSTIAGKTDAKNKPVIVVTDESPECLIAYMGIVYSGNFYVPIDASLPLPRLMKSIESVDPLLIIDVCGLGLSESLKGGFSTEIAKYGDLIRGDINFSDLEKIREESSIFDPLFGMYTSGSTGKPKLVVKNHFSIIDMVEQFTDVFGFDSNSVFGNQAPFYFDVSAKDIYLSMRHRSSMHILPRKFFAFPVKLVSYINENKINTLIWSAFAIRLLEKFKAFKSLKLENVDLVMFSGEKLSNKVVNYWCDNIDARLVNLYGTTETTFNCTYHIIQKPLDMAKEIPIGKSFPNNKVMLLDEKDCPSLKGEKGEICVSGSTLAIGYYNDLERTRGSFVQNPLNEAYPETIYKTGDIGFLNDEDEIVFVSRMDHQVKHMGYRIELDEIETLVNNMEKVDITCCLYDKAKEKISLYYQAEKQMDGEIFNRLKEVFPKQMLPNRLIFSEALPLNKNGKIDRKAIREKDIDV